VPKFSKVGVKFNVPILPVPNKVRFEVVLPLKVPEPKIVFATAAVPTVSVFPFISKISPALLKLIAFPAIGAETVKLLNNCTIVLPDAG
jgi:hypothetical protein